MDWLAANWMWLGLGFAAFALVSELRNIALAIRDQTETLKYVAQGAMKTGEAAQEMAEPIREARRSKRDAA